MSKLPPKYNAVAVPFFLTMIMSFVISGISTWRALGLSGNFFQTWMPSWAMSWAIAFPTVLFVLPLSRKIVGLFVEPPRLP